MLGFYTDPTGEVVSSVSSAEEHDGKLWMGNLLGNYVSYIPLDELPADAAPQPEQTQQQQPAGAKAEL